MALTKVTGSVLGDTDSTDIDYTHSATDAVERTLQSKLEDTVSVKDFGAVGDGVTNDYDAIQAAIDAVIANGGGTVFFPTGTYKTEAMLSCNPAGYAGKGVILKGEFYESIIQPVLSSTYALECRADGGHSKVIIDGIFLDGSNCTGTASGLFMHRNHNGSGASDLFIYNFPDYGLHISENWTMNFYNVEIRNCDVGLKIYADNTYGDVAAGNINNIAFYGCSFAANNYGIDIGDVNYRTTYPLAGSYPFQNLGFYNCNISNVVRGIRSYYTIGMNLQNPYQ